LDFCYLRNPENLSRLANSLAPLRPHLRGLPFVWDAATLRNGAVFTLETSLGPVDLLAEIAGVGDFDKVKACSKLVEAFGRQFWTLDLRGLIASKRAAGRSKDWEALAELESLLEASEG
jgi:hypothetical protein